MRGCLESSGDTDLPERLPLSERRTKYDAAVARQAAASAGEGPVMQFRCELRPLNGPMGGSLLCVTLVGHRRLARAATALVAVQHTPLRSRQPASHFALPCTFLCERQKSLKCVQQPLLMTRLLSVCILSPQPSPAWYTPCHPQSLSPLSAMCNHFSSIIICVSFCACLPPITTLGEDRHKTRMPTG